MYKQYKLITTIIGIGIIISLAMFVSAGYLTQEQLDELEFDSFTPLTLQCHVLGVEPYIYYIDGYYKTFFTCFDIEKMDDGLYWYHNESIFETAIDGELLYKIYNESGYDIAEQYYWDKTTKQAIEQFYGLIKKFKGYQTSDETYWQDFDGELW